MPVYTACQLRGEIILPITVVTKVSICQIQYNHIHKIINRMMNRHWTSQHSDDMKHDSLARQIHFAKNSSLQHTMQIASYEVSRLRYWHHSTQRNTICWVWPTKVIQSALLQTHLMTRDKQKKDTQVMMHSPYLLILSFYLIWFFIGTQC